MYNKKINKYNYYSQLRLNLKPVPARLLQVLANLSNEKGIVDGKSQNYIARCMNVTRQTVSKNTKLLEKVKLNGLPLITVKRVRTNKGTFKIHTYIINFLAYSKLWISNIDNTVKSYIIKDLNNLIHELSSDNVQLHTKKEKINIDFKYFKRDSFSILKDLKKFINSISLAPSRVVPLLSNISDRLINFNEKIYNPKQYFKKCFENYLIGQELENVLTKFALAFGFDQDRDKPYTIDWNKTFQNI
ncbi:MarR family transcriptional regulator [Senegalia massiliensis]|uniref:MarR family transcriptional regulator n=1 Tax=Senegalia massiliensis TaxID=1720316 RepID=A0A845R1N7_9CLOT|nr:helix-turn-helix domain-containing protein [Senegalia massiliensis]NBI07636.1 MarR family transcriptional regulator [Senegalia massiliensis]